MKIGHIALSVSNLETSLLFYEKVFGLKCVEKHHIDDAGLDIWLLKKDDVTLELFRFEDHEKLPEYRKDLDSDLKTLGCKHFALQVDEIDKTHQSFKEAGVEWSTGIRTFENGLKYFFIKDPDGVLIELIEAS